MNVAVAVAVIVCLDVHLEVNFCWTYGVCREGTHVLDYPNPTVPASFRRDPMLSCVTLPCPPHPMRSHMQAKHPQWQRTGKAAAAWGTRGPR